MNANFEISLPRHGRCAELSLRRARNGSSGTRRRSTRTRKQASGDWFIPLVHAFCGDILTGYEQALAQGADRDQLHEQISRVACRRYTWLRADTDPRKSSSNGQDQELKKDRPFNDSSKGLVSSSLSVRSWRWRLSKRAGNGLKTGVSMSLLKENLVGVNARIEALNEFFKPSVVPARERRQGFPAISSCSWKRKSRRWARATLELRVEKRSQNVHL